MNFIDEEGSKSLGECFSKLLNLKILDLNFSSCEINDEKLKYITDGLSQLKALNTILIDF